jgi:hypothetical protein
MKQQRIVGWALAAVPAIGVSATPGLAEEATLGAPAVITLDRVGCRARKDWWRRGARHRHP